VLTPAEIAALVAATKGAVDLFDRFSGQIKSVLEKRPKEKEGGDDRWRYKVDVQKHGIVVKQDDRKIQTITGPELASKLSEKDLKLVQTLEGKMEEYFELWRKVYESKDAAQDPLVNAQTDRQLNKLIKQMRGELLGIIDFLTKIGVRLDDHYMHVRYLVEKAA